MSSNKNNELGRREFLGKAISGTLTLAVVPSVLTCACDAFASGSEPLAFGTITVDLNDAAYVKLKNDKGSVYVPIGASPQAMIVNRISEGNFVAMSSNCPHQNNRVLLFNSRTAYPNTMPCSAFNHGPSKYDINGEVLSGPTTKPLTRYNVVFDGDHTLTISDTSGGVDIPGQNGFILRQNYPNPFFGKTTIEFTLGTTSVVSFHVQDMNGRDVSFTALGKLSASEQTFVFDGSHLATGMYLYELRTERGSLVKHMQVVR